MVEKVLFPVTDSIEDWSNEILLLHQLVIEGFLTTGLRPIISTSGGTYEKNWQSLKLLEIALSRITGHTNEKVKQLVNPLKELHELRKCRYSSRQYEWEAGEGQVREKNIRYTPRSLPTLGGPRPKLG